MISRSMNNQSIHRLTLRTSARATDSVYTLMCVGSVRIAHLLVSFPNSREREAVRKMLMLLCSNCTACTHTSIIDHRFPWCRKGPRGMVGGMSCFAATAAQSVRANHGCVAIDVAHCFLTLVSFESSPPSRLRRSGENFRGYRTCSFKCNCNRGARRKSDMEQEEDRVRSAAAQRVWEHMQHGNVGSCR
jgi:hypothetical protein